MQQCAQQAKNANDITGVGTTVSEWFDCYTNCSTSTAIKCFITASQCLNDCTLEPEEPEVEPEEPEEPEQPPEEEEEDIPPAEARRRARQPQRDTRRQALRDRFNRDSTRNVKRGDKNTTGLSSSFSDSPLSLAGGYDEYPRPKSGSGFTKLDKQKKARKRDEVPLDEIEGDSLWYGWPGFGWGRPGFGWPGFGWGRPGFGWPGFGWGGPGFGWRWPGYGWW